MASERSSRSPVLLDPFVFPSETRGRFRMLLAASLAFAWSLGSYLVAVPEVPIIPADIRPETQDVLDRLVARDTDQLAPEEVSETRALFRSYAPMFEHRLLKLVLSIFLMITIFAGTAFLYLRHSDHLRRRYRARPLTREESPRVIADLQGLVTRIGLPRNPRWEYRPGLFDGLALGPRGREVVLVSGRPKLLEATWSDVSRAVVLHELGHIVNGDVWIREVSWSLWRMLSLTIGMLGGAVAAVSLAIGKLQFPVFGKSSWSTWDLLAAAGKTTAIFLMVGWIWVELIRVREFYADWRVAAWGLREPLRQRLRLASSYLPRFPSSRFLTALRESWEKRRGSRCLGRPLRWLEEHGLRRHPSNDRRIKMLEDPAALFRVTPDLTFLSGLLLAVIFGQLAPLIDDLIFVAMIFVGPFFLFLGPLALLVPLAILALVILMIAHWITGTLGVQVQRETVADLAEGRGGGRLYLRLGKPAFLFALGLEAGLLLTLWGAPSAVLRFPLWLIGFTFLIWIWLAYQRAMSGLWLGSHVGPAPPSRARSLLSWSAAALLAVLLGSALVARVAVRVANDPGFLLAPMSPDNPLYPIFVSGLVETSIGIFVFAFGGALIFGLFSFLASAAWLSLRPRRCPTCGASVSPRRAAGRRCGSCGHRLALWLHPSGASI